MRSRLLSLAIAIVAVAWTSALTVLPARADEGWVITSFDSQIGVNTDSSLLIQEDIRVDFGSLQKHGIFRTIPLRYRYDNTNDRYYRLNVVSVTDGTRPLEYTTSVDSDNEVIKIGDPNLLVTGVNRYVIKYSVQGAMNSFADHDELFWNVDGALWPVPKRSVTATVRLPAGSFQKAACYQGSNGSTETCQSQPAGDTVSFSSTRPLASGEEMSVVTALNKGAVSVPPPLLEPRKRQFPQDAFDVNAVTVIISLLIVVLGVGLVVWMWSRHGRDRAYLTQYYLTNDPRDRLEPLFHHEPVVVEFGPPQNLRPAELGIILDESADNKDVTATIVDLAVRGHMTITEIPGKKDWSLTWKGGDVSALQPYEKTLLDGIFAGRQEVKLSELRGTFAPTLKLAESQIYSDAMSRKLFTVRPDWARAGWGCLGIGVIVLGCALAFLLGVGFGWGFVGVAVLVVGMVLTAACRSMPQRTAAGHELMHHTLGFRLYMATAEKYRQQFAEKAQIFTDLLPYAIVFGCVTQWARAFAGIDTSASTSGWYVGQGPFQAALLAGNLEAMNSTISSAISYTPPSSGSSSGFGGGGFSGGGGGGGGGGSW
ncbi:MAG TPA: DUF2207 domain-containing protein [Candidatus Sulfotelmatobacter sp.]|nr:DUF2207 domain-containing protein [Candidatus Sulfotelmatobacter sp.]